VPLWRATAQSRGATLRRAAEVQRCDMIGKLRAITAI
jgi:hypothetical protein